MWCFPCCCGGEEKIPLLANPPHDQQYHLENPAERDGSPIQNTTTVTRKGVIYQPIENASEPFPQEITSNSNSLIVQQPQVKTWSERGDFHLRRKEYDLGIDAYTKALQDAERQNNVSGIAESITHIGKVYLEKEQWIFCAKIFNAAYALYENEKDKENLLSLLFRSEKLFLERSLNINDFLIKKFLKLETYLERREKLQSLRRKIHLNLEEKLPATLILKEFSQQIVKFLDEIAQSSFLVMGEPPCDFTFISLGSLSRQETSPYSDLEFAILIADEKTTHLDYFRKLVQWLEFQIICLGETEIKLLENGHSSPVKRGFAFDDGGNTPLGKRGYVELIRTAPKMAEFQSVRFYQEDLILSNILRSTDVILGCQALFQNYKKSMSKILSNPSDNQLTIAQARALHIVSGHLIEFEPKLDHDKEEYPIFNIKMELYRLPNFLIAALADYYNIDSNNTLERVDALIEKTVLCMDGGSKLKDAFNAILQLRIRCHLYYGFECDDAFHPFMRNKMSVQDSPPFFLSDQNVEEIVEIYRVILPLHQYFKEACQKKDFTTLSTLQFYDDSLSAKANGYRRLQQYAKAEKCYQQILGLNPEDRDAIADLMELYRLMAKWDLAKEYAQKAIVLGTKLEDKPLLSRAYRLLGLVSKEQGDFKAAVKHYQESLEIDTELSDQDSIAIDLNNLGSIQFAIGDLNQAINFFELSQKLDFSAISLNNLGNAWIRLGDIQKGIGYLESALEINKLAGEQSPLVASNLNNIAAAYYLDKDFQKALEICQASLAINRKIFGEWHPETATNYINLGEIWLHLGDSEKGLFFADKSFKIYTKVFGKDHLKTATALSHLALVYIKLKDQQQSLKLAQEAVDIIKRIYGLEHPTVAPFLAILATCCEDVDVNQAISFNEEALKIYQNISEAAHPDAVTVTIALGQLFQKQGDFQKAKEYFSSALESQKILYGKEHRSIANTLNYLGVCLKEEGQPAEALPLLQEALKLNEQHYGLNHENTLNTYSNLGIVYVDLYQFETAIQLLEKALSISQQLSVEKTTQRADMLNNLSLAYDKFADTLARPDTIQSAVEYKVKAMNALQEALDIYQEKGADDLVIGRTLNNLGELWRKVGQPQKAKQNLEEALKFLIKGFKGKNDPLLATCYNNLGLAFTALGRPKQAIEYLTNAMQIDQAHYGSNHPKIAIRLDNLGQAWFKLGDVKGALEYHEKAFAIFIQLFPKNHPSVLICSGNIEKAQKALK